MTFVVAVDGSPFAVEVHARAVDLARRESASLVLPRAVTIPPSQPIGIDALRRTRSSGRSSTRLAGR
jgi:hypothetical protein